MVAIYFQFSDVNCIQLLCHFLMSIINHISPMAKSNRSLLGDWMAGLAVLSC